MLSLCQHIELIGNPSKASRGLRQYNDGRVVPPSSELLTLVMVPVPSLPPDAKSRFTTGSPPACSVIPAAIAMRRMREAKVPGMEAHAPFVHFLSPIAIGRSNSLKLNCSNLTI